MTTAAKLQQQLEAVFSGQPWYGDNIYSILDKVTYTSAYKKTSENTHSVMEIILHMLSWTEEVMDRLNGMTAGMPSSGNWPEPGEPDEQKWKLWIEDLKLANTNLIGIIKDLPEEQWNKLIDDQRGEEPVTTHEQLVYGFIEHQIYHAGQIALLVKING